MHIRCAISNGSSLSSLQARDRTDHIGGRASIAEQRAQLVQRAATSTRTRSIRTASSAAYEVRKK